MSTKYPANIDNSTSLPVFSNKITPDLLNDLRQAVLNIQIEMGIEPSSIYSTVRGRIDYIESALNDLIAYGSPDATTLTKGIIKLSNDLGGTALLPQVTGIKSRQIDITNQQDGYALVYSSLTDNYKFAPVVSSDASVSSKGIVKLSNDLGGTALLPQVTGILNKQIDASIQQDGYALVYNSSSTNYKFIKNNPSNFADVQLTSSINTILGSAAGVYYSLGQVSFNKSDYRSYNTYTLEGVYSVINSSTINTLTLSLYNLTIGSEITNASFTSTSPTSFSIIFNPTSGLNIYEVRGKINVALPSGADGFSVSNIKIRIL